MEDDDISPLMDTPSHQICAMLFDKTTLIKSYSDQTGRFPIPSSRGNHYIFVLYHHDTNSIHAKAIPNRQAASIRTAWETTHKTLVRQGHPPNLHVLDNECYQELKDAFTKYNIAFQRVPPKEHPSSDAIIGNQTIFFIPPHQVPTGRKVTYANFVCIMRPGKAEQYRIRMTVGGDKLDTFQDDRSPAVGITDTKLHINSTISDAKHGARYCTGNLKDFFLVSDMPIFQYMRVHRKYVTNEILDEYGLTDEYYDSRGYVYLEIRKGMYGPKEARILAYDQLKAHLQKYGYSPVCFTPGFWYHNTRRTTFTLAVDDFGIKYFCKADADHLFAAIHDKYALTKDWTGESYLGLTLKWSYPAGYVDISMSDYVPKALAKFQHDHPKSAQHAPHQWTQPAYGQKVQYANTDQSPLLNKKDTQRVQSVSGTFLYYARAVDPTILPALNEISNNQAQPTIVTGKACDLLLDYLATTHPNAVIRYYASDMILHIVANAAYLVLPNQSINTKIT
jgi:hypothetical protein